MSTMSRKSARLLSRTKSDEDTVPCAKVNRKRKAEEDLHEETAMIKRTKTYSIETQWIPISENSSISTCTLVPTSHPPTPESEEKKPSEIILGSKFRFRNYFISTNRSSPLPKLSWADSREVWQFMLKKESHYNRDSNMFKKHPALQSRMRTILLDWLIEVCEVYRLHRETFYLGVDFVDRYISLSSGLQKHQLQLIGITSLFIAAKLEEIYPPKIAEFAYVTDGACTEDEILDQELIMLKALKWDLSPLTTNGWLNLYLQVANIEHIVETEHGFVFPQYSSHAFIQIARLVDLCILDTGCLQFPYSVLAASALYHLTTKEIALSVSGFSWADILQCVSWMAPFAITVRESGPAEVKFFPNVAPEDSHHIQTHAIDLNLLEKAQERQEQVLNSLRAGSPDLQAQVITQLTPPHSNKKTGITLDPLCSPHQDQLLENTEDCK
ncbi:G1/S-specific cyclin-E-like [Pecten maximus]|uniref:G1/S-specific cyclin-E-like n=1 Tax=Pecten maximus TaxID=6579 RepID=UPI0014589514|nr:G1/S-specific cyclin-E-like [Pecten maximus]XP_033753915.1 G1/S-specific cyclin-E-like [Pecten maximus]